MKTRILKPVYFPASYRFKSWSRKSYAVFNSLHLIVNIGVLRLDICERLATKTAKCFAIETTCEINGDKDPPPEDDIGNEGSDQNKLVCLLGFIYLAAFILANRDECGKLWPHFADNFITSYNTSSLSLFIPSFFSSLFHRTYIFNKLFHINPFNQKSNGHDEEDRHDINAWHYQYCWIQSARHHYLFE